MNRDFAPAWSRRRVQPSTQQITMELLELCEEFLRRASPIVHAELCRFLTDRGHRGGLGWFLDALGFTTLHHATLDG